MQDDRTEAITALVDRLALSGIDIDPRRCDPVALRLTAADLLDLAALLSDDA